MFFRASISFCLATLSSSAKREEPLKITIDLRSALIGLFAGVVLMFTIGASIGSGIAPTQRYQVAGTHSHAVIVNTETGQAWNAHLPEHGGGPSGAFLKPKNERP